jgi:hypothetical protein
MSLKTKRGLETCLFFGVTHTFSLPVTTKDGVEIFNPKNESSYHKSHAVAYKRSNLGLRIHSCTGEKFLQIVNAFSDGIHFITGESLRSQYVIFGNGYSHDSSTDIRGWAPFPFEAAADDKALALCLERLPVLIPLNLNSTFNRVSNSLRFYDLGQSSESPDLALMSYVSSLEGLFSVSNTELSFRLSLTISKFLEDKSESQKALFKQLRDLYVVRSKLSHGDKICSDEEQAGIQLAEYWVPFAAEIAWRCNQKLVKDNLISMFNSKKDHAAFLDALIFKQS